MKATELKEKAKSLGIKGYYKMKKQQLLDAIKELESDHYYMVMKNNDGIIQIPILQDTETLVMKEFYTKFRSNNEYNMAELFRNGNKIRHSFTYENK